MDSTCLEKETEDHSSSQQKITQADIYIWDQSAQNCGGSPGFGQVEWDDLWWKAIQKEMSAVKVACKILDKDENHLLVPSI